MFHGENAMRTDFPISSNSWNGRCSVSPFCCQIIINPTPDLGSSNQLGSWSKLRHVHSMWSRTKCGMWSELISTKILRFGAGTLALAIAMAQRLRSSTAFFVNRLPMGTPKYPGQSSCPLCNWNLGVYTIFKHTPKHIEFNIPLNPHYSYIPQGKLT